MPAPRLALALAWIGFHSSLLSACSDEREGQMAGGPRDASEDAQADAQADAQQGNAPPPRYRAEALELPNEHPFATDFAFVPRSAPDAQELLLLQRDGLVTHYRLREDALERLGAFELGDVYSRLDCGLISIAFDPDYVDNGFVYFGLCTSEKESGVFRFHVDLGDYEATASTRTPIVVAHEPEANRPWHNVGALAFDDQGYLWASFGEKTVSSNAKDPDSVLGSIVRIEPNRDPEGSGYEPAPENPFVDAGGHPAVYAYGVRSPWRIALDASDRLWIGDVGPDEFEEVNVLREPAENFGWPLAEGFCEEDCDNLTDPIVAWPHDEEHRYVWDDEQAHPTTARVAWVGLEYQPRERDRYEGGLTDGMLFGDSCLGNLRIAQVSEDGELVRDEARGHLARGMAALRKGADDYVYGLALGLCQTDKDKEPKTSFFRIRTE